MRKLLIIANWKCNPVTLNEAKRLLNSVRKGLKNIKNKNVEMIICPPFVYIPVLISRKKQQFKFGAQNSFWEGKGAFTGEISPPMIKNLGYDYVILGHSERRKYLREADEMINKKIKAALISKLTPILCIGESLEEREENLTQKILRTQIKKGLKDLERRKIKKVIIAYEPIWAIGTGKACSPEEAEKASNFIRKNIFRLSNRKIAKDIKILYGGSVNSQNAAGYIFGAKLQGLLVGGASLDSKEFVGIIKNFD